MSSSDVDRVVGRVSPFPSIRQAGAVSLSSSASLSDQHLADALLNSPDNGATLDFTHKSLTDVGEDGAERLATAGARETSITRSALVLQHPLPQIALGYNRLATLPTAFALLSRLRYLNLKNNSFSVFPDVLTVIPSLEILDIGRNKIKRLPAQPGSLAKLHVLCVSRNRITRLPSYLADFGNLDVLKVDHNPIEWPSKPTLEMHGSSDEPQTMKDWIVALQKWLRESSQLRLDIKPKPSVESFMSERALNHSIEESLQSWTALGGEDHSEGPTPHAPSFSIDDQSPLHIPPPSKSPSLRFERPPPLRLGSLPPYDPPLRSASPESYLPTPEESVSSTDDDHTAVPRSLPHQRNGSITRRSRDRRPALFGRKSIPDLRTSPRPSDQGHISKTPDSAPSVVPPVPSSLTNGMLRDDFTMPSPLSHSSSSSSEGSKTQRKYPTTPPTSASPTSAERSHPVPDTDRHAYFKRLSALPAHAIANNLPPPLRSLVECARSLYFSASQVHQALSHYITYTVDQKLSSVLRKVTDPAYTYMTQLNRALERFDAVAKKGPPPPLLCKALVESSRDSAAVFGKAIAMLSLQLKILASRDDDRYMRSLVLIFYGAAAEISHAWRSMLPHMESIKPYLSEPRRNAPPKTKGLTIVPSTSHVDSSLSSAGVGSSQSSGFQHNVPIARSRPTPTTLGRTRTTRRHAGSFSSKDVEIGKSLASYDMPLPPGLPSTCRRAGQKSPAAPLSASTLSLLPPSTVGGTGPGTSRHGYHSRQASQISLTASSSSSPQVPLQRPIVEIPLSRTLVDNDALDSMENAVDSAPAIWELMQEMVETMSETPGLSEDFRESINKAKIITERLRVNIVAVRAGDPSTDRTTLRDNAHLFVKIVVKLSNFIKTYGSTHAVFPDLRSKMVALTNSTQEFVMLLHVSSFSPSSTPLPYSPLTAVPVHSANGTANFRGHDDKLGANLSRSCSTHQPKTLKLITPGLANFPRSALPNQSHFNVAMPSRYVMPANTGLVGHANGEIVRGNIGNEG
ncbi:RAM signaling pathway protein-domain-containing protein [Chiua virens]|nr:RAM signaling pathway protein-domain-containing protein [Chiua virens]